MVIKNLVDEDFANYKKPSLFIGFPTCSWKCEKECGKRVCQNEALSKSKDIAIPIEEICRRYINNDITKAVVCGGLEPFDSFDELLDLVKHIRSLCEDDIIIYTGYKKKEIQGELSKLTNYSNIVLKFGRYVPNQKQHYEEILGVNLASPNQYAERIS